MYGNPKRTVIPKARFCRARNLLFRCRKQADSSPIKPRFGMTRSAAKWALPSPTLAALVDLRVPSCDKPSSAAGLRRFSFALSSGHAESGHPAHGFCTGGSHPLACKSTGFDPSPSSNRLQGGRPRAPLPLTGYRGGRSVRLRIPLSRRLAVSPSEVGDPPA